MPTAAERQALAFLAGVALLGGGARVWMQHRSGEESSLPNSSALAVESVGGQLAAIDSARNSRRGKKRTGKAVKASTAHSSAARAPNRAEQMQVMDVDVASAEELEQLPRVGPALAARIVANRDSLGAFGSLTAFGEVRGIGPAMLKLLSPSITFSGRTRASKVTTVHSNAAR